MFRIPRGVIEENGSGNEQGNDPIHYIITLHRSFNLEQMT